jgi:hypothetical protein
MANAIEKKWIEYGKKHLLNRKIIEVRYMTKAEQDALMWNRKAIVLVLDNGAMLFPSADDEGNDAGALFGNDAKGELTFPVR